MTGISMLVRRVESARLRRYRASHAKNAVSTSARMAGIRFFTDKGHILLAIESRQVTLKQAAGQVVIIPDVPPVMNPTVEAKLKQIPTGPGVYLYKDGTGQTIYVGKAKSLRNR